MPVDWSSDALATFYLVFTMACLLPDPWWLISFASLILMIPVQQAVQRVNERHVTLSTEERNDNYSTANVATIVIGGLLGAPEEATPNTYYRLTDLLLVTSKNLVSV